MNVTLGLNERLTRAVAVAAGDDGHDVLVLAHGLDFDLPLTTMCMTHFYHAGEFRRI